MASPRPPAGDCAPLLEEAVESAGWGDPGYDEETAARWAAFREQQLELP